MAMLMEHKVSRQSKQSAGMGSGDGILILLSEVMQSDQNTGFGNPRIPKFSDDMLQNYLKLKQVA